MADLSQLSDDELAQRIAAAKAAASKPVSDLTDEELSQRIADARAAKPKVVKEPPPITGFDNKPVDLDPTAGMNFGEKLFTGNTARVGDIILAGQQLAAKFGLGDKEALAKEAADKEKVDAPLMHTAGGMIGSMIPDLALGTAAGAGAVRLLPNAVRAAAAIPKGAENASRAARAVEAMTSAGAQGAEAGVLTPGEDYSPGKQAMLGALLGVGGDVAARGAGRVLNPVQRAAEPVLTRLEEQIGNLSGMPGILAENLSDSRAVKALTDALAQVPLFGAGVNKARNARLGQYTREVTGAAGDSGGLATPNLTEEGLDELNKWANRRADFFRTGPDVPLGNVSEALRPQLAEVAQTAALAGKPTPGTLNRAINATTPTAPASNVQPPSATGDRPSILNTIIKAFEEQQNPSVVRTTERVAGEMPGASRAGVPPPSMVPPTPSVLPADTVITARSIASDQAHSAANAGPRAVLEAKGSKALAGQLEDALKATMPDKGQAFDRWKAEYGVIKAIEDAGVTKEGHILPENFLKTIDQNAMQTPLAKRTIAMAERSPSPQLQDNRSLMTRILMGSAIPGAGGAAGFFGGDDNRALGATAGAGGSLALAHLLLGTKGGGRYLTGRASSDVGRFLQSAQLKDLLQMLATTKGGEIAGAIGSQ